ncbi:uncharacterized protein LOC129313811 [Prosopis cineraria]|uniref:uncharacterized protein LOC129313811 n=1 Tax=Prosopis cineraria TaxID=364024 RepID=UPI00240EB6BF|nr:uncharacterized protein LOC129313811 [Prosopis cineraria]
MEKEECSKGWEKAKEVVLDLKENTTGERGALVSKLLTGKNLKKGVVTSMIKKGWNMEEGVTIHDTDKLAFSFRFDRAGDYTRILKGRPWSIQGQLLSLQPWEDFMVFKEVDFDWSPFWVQFHGLPLEAMTQNNAINLTQAVGEAVMIEHPMVHNQLSRTFIRTKVLINTRKPLISGFWTPRPGKDPVWVGVKYERLQSFCYHCG